MSPRLKLALGAILILMIVLCGRCAAGTAEMFYIFTLCQFSPDMGPPVFGQGGPLP
mgnify:CR=1 FL=1